MRGKVRVHPGATAVSRSAPEAEIGPWSRLAPLLTECARTLINGRDESTLARDVCRLLTRRGGYRAVWICLKPEGSSGGFRLSASCGAGSALAASACGVCGADPRNICPIPSPGRSGARDASGLVSLHLREGRDLLGMLHIKLRSNVAASPEELQALEGLAGNVALRIARLRAGRQHRQAKNAIIDTLRRFHASLQATPLVAIQRVDRAGLVRYWNEASTGLYGFAPERALNRRLSDLLLEGEEAAAFDRLVQSAWDTGHGAAPADWKVACADGSRRCMSASLIPIREEGRVVDMFCMEVDVTGRRRAEKALRDSEALYRNLVDAAPLAVLVHQDGMVRFANAAALELFGANQPDELCWRPLASLVHPDAQERLEALSGDGPRRPVELELVRLDGGVVDAEVACLALHWENQPAEQWLIRDRTLTNRIQWELEAAREKLARIFQSSPAAILICSLPDHRLIEANPAFWRLIGYERKELLGRTLAELEIWGEDQPALMPASPRQARRMPSFEVPLRTRAGDLRHMLISVEDFDFGDQRSRLLIMIDVTERKRLESDLRESQKLEAMGLLARGVAHDLNNILTVIQGHQSLIPLGSRLSPQAQTSLAGIGEAVAQASELTRQLLTFSRKRQFEARRVDINELIGGVARLLRPTLGKQIQLELECAPGLGLVWADPGMIEQVILNLGANARDAMPQGGRLTFTTELRFVRKPPASLQPAAAGGDYLCLTVRDTGRGIARENLGRVFEPFFTTKAVAKGTGLGLATVRHIVEQHQGWIEVDSAEGRGTTFRVFLPAVAKSEVAAPKSKLAPAPEGARQTILLVEDEPAVRDLARQVLERAGYRVLAAENGTSATRLWRRHGAAVRLLIADLVLPGGLDGGELAQRLQAERPDLRVILSTGYGMDFDDGRWQALAAARLLPKPFSPDALARYVRECLEES